MQHAVLSLSPSANDRAAACQPGHLPGDAEQVYKELKPLQLQGVLMGAAVWVCCDGSVAHKLDSLCFGNMDGGIGTATHVRRLLHEAGLPADGECAVRLSLDEAFFMAHALGILGVSEEAGARAAQLGITALWQRLQQLRSDFFLLYLAYHHFRSKVKRPMGGGWRVLGWKGSTDGFCLGCLLFLFKPQFVSLFLPSFPFPFVFHIRVGSLGPVCSTAPILCCTNAILPWPTLTIQFWWCRWVPASALPPAGTIFRLLTACQPKCPRSCCCCMCWSRAVIAPRSAACLV